MSKDKATLIYVDNDGETWGGLDRIIILLPGDKRSAAKVRKTEDTQDVKDLPTSIDPLALLRIAHHVLHGRKEAAATAAAMLPGARKLEAAHEDVFTPAGKSK